MGQVILIAVPEHSFHITCKLYRSGIGQSLHLSLQLVEQLHPFFDDLRIDVVLIALCTVEDAQLSLERLEGAFELSFVVLLLI